MRRPPIPILVTPRANKPPRSGLSRSDFVHWPIPRPTIGGSG